MHNDKFDNEPAIISLCAEMNRLSDDALEGLNGRKNQEFIKRLEALNTQYRKNPAAIDPREIDNCRMVDIQRAWLRADGRNHATAETIVRNAIRGRDASGSPDLLQQIKEGREAAIAAAGQKSSATGVTFGLR